MSSLKCIQNVWINSLIPPTFDLTSGRLRGTQGMPRWATQMSGSDIEVIFLLSDPYSTNIISNIFGLNFEVLEGAIALLKTRF